MRAPMCGNTWRALPLVLGALLAVTGCRSVSDAMVPVLQAHLKRYPAMQIEDVYKLVHQAAFGNGHLIADEAGARAYLQSEFDSVEADASEPLMDRISPNGTVVRVSLRAFKAQGTDLRVLWDWMLMSDKIQPPGPEAFERWWQQIVDAASARTLSFDAAALRSFGAAKKAEGYPAIHHSAIYSSQYHPAYRVVVLATRDGGRP